MRVDIEQWGIIFIKIFLYAFPKVQEFPTSVGHYFHEMPEIATNCPNNLQKKYMRMCY